MSDTSRVVRWRARRDSEDADDVVVQETVGRAMKGAARSVARWSQRQLYHGQSNHAIGILEVIYASDVDNLAIPVYSRP